MIIYCIEDINDLKYVGKTKQKLYQRLSEHISHRNRECSSNKLNLFNSIIYTLEECEKEVSKEREKYWINKIDCVNILKLNFNRQEHKLKMKEQKRLYDIEYRKRRKLKKETLKLKTNNK